MRLKLNSKVLLSTATLAFLATTTTVSANGYYYDYSTPTDAAAATGFFGLSLLYVCCVCLVPLIIGAILAYVVYKDAKKNNVDNAALWAVLTFFFSVIGLLVYYLAIKPEAIKKNAGGTSTPTNSGETTQS